MEFTKQFMQDVVWEDSSPTETIYDKIIDNRRWSIDHEIVFKVLSSGKFYRSYYSVGATESQDESPYEYDNDTIKCFEVEPVEQTIIVYKLIEG